jgi:hypothetical protein
VLENIVNVYETRNPENYGVPRGSAEQFPHSFLPHVRKSVSDHLWKRQIFQKYAARVYLWFSLKDSSSSFYLKKAGRRVGISAARTRCLLLRDQRMDRESRQSFCPVVGGRKACPTSLANSDLRVRLAWASLVSRAIEVVV